LSEVQRPLIFCSQRYVLAHGELLPFLGWSAKSHAQGIDVQSMAMRYHTIDGGISKVAARLNDALPPAIFEALREDLRREAHVLEALERAGVEAPNLIDFVDGPEEVVLTRSAYPGDLVSDLLGSLTAQERQVVTSDVLDQLASLEAHGLYHSDLRLWNVVLDREGKRAHLIDHGSIRSTPTDVVRPNDAYLSLAIFLASLWSSRADQTGEHLPRSLAIDAADLPAHVVGLITSILVLPRDGQVFARCCAEWADLLSNASEALWPPIPVSWGWLRASYEQIAALNTELVAAEAETSMVRWRLEADRDYWRTARHEADSAIEQQLETISALQADRDVISQNRQLVIDELAATKLTLSWRITTPVRFLRRLLPRR
jgi:O-antigen chain-terminating methyltransferase